MRKSVIKNKIEEISEINISIIDINKNQPRKLFNKESIAEMADSIKEHGIIQPIIVKKNKGRYTIVAGERRYRASRVAGIKTIPAIIKKTNDIKAQEIAMIENIHRENLTPIEEAYAIKRIMIENNLTQNEVSKKLGKSRSTIANILRLTSLDQYVIDLINNKKISEGHAKIIASISDKKKQVQVANKIVKNRMTIRELEKANISNNSTKKKAKYLSVEIEEIKNQLEEKMATKVRILGDERKGKIIIDYYTADDIDRILKNIIG